MVKVSIRVEIGWKIGIKVLVDVAILGFRKVFRKVASGAKKLKK